jgi:penicillin-binding protein 1A
MSDYDVTDIPAPPRELAEPPTPSEEEDLGGPPPPKPRIRKLRLLIIAIPLLLLAFVSAVFGMVMAIASDIPAIENQTQYKNAKNSIIYDSEGHEIGILSDPQNRILVSQNQIPPIVRNAVVAVEDKRFYTDPGVDLRGMVRALVADAFAHSASQGGSTITEQFVKNALAAQDKRTIFEKLREAAIAFHLTRRWSPKKIITEYLNTIYFGNGAYGIESAARTYFGNNPNDPTEYQCGTPGHALCITLLSGRPDQAALLAGMIASPIGYDPALHPQHALARRNLVLNDMYQQGYITYSEYSYAMSQALPTAADIVPPQDKSANPGLGYYTSWIRQQVIDKYGAQLAFDGGLQVHTSLDPSMQQAAEQAMANYINPSSGPQAALVAIDNQTGEVRAMVGGFNYDQVPFNLATQGERQPGSSFKAFVLADALLHGISPDSVWPSEKRVFTVPNSRGQEHFVVRNFESTYAGDRTLTDATTYSDNSVFATVGIEGIGHCCAGIARLAQRMGIRTPVSHNYAITIGGLHTGVTPIDMAHAYETLAEGGQRISGSLGATPGGPVGIVSVRLPNGQVQRNGRQAVRVLPGWVANTEDGMLHNVVTQGTGTKADPGVWAAGKTGTTDNYGDAWFVGFTHDMTVAVWVGYPNDVRSMATDFNGQPVEGGTFPALIWHDFMVSALQIVAERHANALSGATGASGASGAYSSSSSSSSYSSSSSSQSSSGSGSGSSGTPTTGNGGGGQSSGGGGSGGAGNGGGNTPSSPTPQGNSPPAQSSPGGGGSSPSSGSSPSAGSSPPAGSSPGASGGASAPAG